jgi:uncharacterized membrane protein YdjX (TVP38/TMEM64 family)
VPSPEETRRLSLAKPSIDDFVFEGESTPLLLQKKVVFSIAGAFIAIVVAYIIASEMLGVSYNIDAEPFRDWVDRQGMWGPIVFMAAMAVGVLFAPIPNAPIFVAAGLVWGPVIGTLYSMAGMMVGSVMAFYLSRFLGRRHLPRLIGGKAAQRLDHIADNMGGRVIFWARMLPVVNFDWISYVAGLTSIRFVTFFFFSFLGMLTPTIVGVAAGDGLGRDIRITLGLGGLWVAGIVGSAMFFWFRRRQWQRRRREAAASVAALPAQE